MGQKWGVFQLSNYSDGGEYGDKKIFWTVF